MLIQILFPNLAPFFYHFNGTFLGDITYFFESFYKLHNVIAQFDTAFFENQISKLENLDSVIVLTHS